MPRDADHSGHPAARMSDLGRQDPDRFEHVLKSFAGRLTGSTNQTVALLVDKRAEQLEKAYRLYARNPVLMESIVVDAILMVLPMEVHGIEVRRLVESDVANGRHLQRQVR